MTTIAYDGRYLASDSQVSCGSTIETHDTQKIFTYRKIGDNNNETCVLSFSGDIHIINYLIKKSLWDIRDLNIIKKINQETGYKDEALLGIYLSSDKTNGIYEFKHGEIAATKINGISSHGSGWRIAIGAMHAGKTAIEAIQIVSKLDIYTNDRVQYYDYQSKKLEILK